jgi:hypothetical protein
MSRPKKKPKKKQKMDEKRPQERSRQRAESSTRRLNSWISPKWAQVPLVPYWVMKNVMLWRHRHQRKKKGLKIHGPTLRFQRLLRQLGSHGRKVQRAKAKEAAIKE